MYVGVKIVANPSWRPAGWTPNTLFGLSRFLSFCLGALWLMAVTFLSTLLAAAQRRGRLVKTAAAALGVLALVFALTYLILLILG